MLPAGILRLVPLTVKPDFVFPLLGRLFALLRYRLHSERYIPVVPVLNSGCQRRILRRFCFRSVRSCDLEFELALFFVLDPELPHHLTPIQPLRQSASYLPVFPHPGVPLNHRQQFVPGNLRQPLRYRGAFVCVLPVLLQLESLWLVLSWLQLQGPPPNCRLYLMSLPDPSSLVLPV